MENYYQTRSELAFAYKVFAHLNWDDNTYTHLSARVPHIEGVKGSFLIQRFGLLYEEVTADNLIEIDFDGNVIKGDPQFNSTGYVIHGAIYKARPDLNAVFHLHTIAGVAVSTNKMGLLPISQFALHFHERMSYHEYNSLALDFHGQGGRIAKSLGKNKAMILQNHGTLTCGETIHEAFLYMQFLEKACQVQVRSPPCNDPHLLMPPREICEAAYNDMRNYEDDFGARDWAAWKRKLNYVLTTPMLETLLIFDELEPVTCTNDSKHFATLKPPLAPDSFEVDIFERLVSKDTLLLGYTQQLLRFCTRAIDMNPPNHMRISDKCITGDWFSIDTHHETIIGDGVLNLVGGSLVKHLSKYCNTLVIRFFECKLPKMKYATYFKHNTEMLPPDEIIKTQKNCSMYIWYFN